MFRVEIHGGKDVLHHDFPSEEMARRCFDRLITDFPECRLRLWNFNGAKMTQKHSRVIAKYPDWY